jgi:hypothetical protein
MTADCRRLPIGARRQTDARRICEEYAHGEQNECTDSTPNRI